MSLQKGVPLGIRVDIRIQLFLKTIYLHISACYNFIQIQSSGMDSDFKFELVMSLKQLKDKQGFEAQLRVTCLPTVVTQPASLYVRLKQ